jgi:hypothetical protein
MAWKCFLKLSLSPYPSSRKLERQICIIQIFYFHCIFFILQKQGGLRYLGICKMLEEGGGRGREGREGKGREDGDRAGRREMNVLTVVM